MAEPIKPSDIILNGSFPPLLGVFGRSELEVAAALIVRACQAQGDAWCPATPGDIRTVLEADVAAKTEPFASLASNPFVRPDIWDLVAKGFAAFEGEGTGRPVRLTEAGLEKLAASRWNKKLPVPNEAL